jgi:hypothetical protein
MNLPAAGWLGVRRRRLGMPPVVRFGPPRGSDHTILGRAQTALGLYAQRPGLTIVIFGLQVCAVSGTLEALNPGNYWIPFEDVSCAVAPTAVAVAVAVAAHRSRIANAGKAATPAADAAAVPPAAPSGNTPTPRPEPGALDPA